jgi:hypothetical protein
LIDGFRSREYDVCRHDRSPSYSGPSLNQA